MPEPKNVEELIEQCGGYWDGEYKKYPVVDWKYEVANGDTRSGYWQWVFSKLQEIEHVA